MFEIPANWTFENEGVARDFDRHVREELPWYDLATHAVEHVARHYITDGGLVYDVGASTGNIGRAIAATLEDRRARLVGIEPAAEMADRYDAPGELVIAGIEEVELEPCDLAICFLSLMFIPPRSRRAVIRRLLEVVEPGGALVVFDKREASGGYVGTILARLTLAGKRAAGVDPARIVGKELSLAGVQRPISPTELPSSAVEFFRFGEFSGWLIEKTSY